MSHYVEILITTEDFETASPVGLGMMLQRIYQEYGKTPIMIRVTDDLAVGPWATDQENNWNRIDN
jgi:hypothetical protein